MFSTQAFDLNRNVLIANVKKDNVEHFLDGSARLYYLGKHVPKALSLNMLHYFVPYIGKQCGLPYSGIRDLYLIRKARSGCRREGEAIPRLSETGTAYHQLLYGFPELRS